MRALRCWLLLVVGCVAAGSLGRAAEAGDEEEVVLSTVCFVVPSHDWTVVVGAARFGIIQYDWADETYVWLGERFWCVPVSAPTIAAAFGLGVFACVGLAVAAQQRARVPGNPNR